MARELSETFNENCVHIVQNTSGKTDACGNNIFDTDQGKELIKQSFSVHLSISRI